MATKAPAKKKVGMTKHFTGRTVALPTEEGVFAVPTATYREETDESFLSLLWEEGTDNQIKLLSSLTYPNGKKIIQKGSNTLLEIVGLLKSSPFEEVIEFLQEATGPDYVLWKQPVMDSAITNLQRELELHEEQEIGIKGIGRCRFCSSNELVFVAKQLRSGDEPATIFFRCVSCKKNWRE